MNKKESTKPVFTASELLTIHEMMGRFDKEKPGYATEEDIDSIAEKIKEWYSNATQGKSELQ